MTEPCKTPCSQCPWRISNQGKRHRNSFYTKKNLTRLWNQIRRGGHPQSCHLTDPSHPDHVDAGAHPDATPQECPGSVIVVYRELEKLASYGAGGNTIDGDGVEAYLAENRRGLTKSGILYWALQRIQLAGVPWIGGAPLPEVDVDDVEVGRPGAGR